MTDIVWIHGFPLSNAIWEPQKRIAGAHHVMPNLPGFGDAPLQPIDTIDGFANWILEQHAGPAIFAGVSMGGYIALAVTRIAPERVRGLVLVDTRETADTPEQKQGRYDTIAKVEHEGTHPVVTSMLPKMIVDQSLEPEVRRIMESASAEGCINALRAMAERSATDLSQIKVPVLIAVGEDDTITPPSDAERMAAAIPQATLLRIPHAAHLSHFEKPDLFNEAVTTLLGKAGNGR